jgi:arylsulfatase A-like enzyme
MNSMAGRNQRIAFPSETLFFSLITVLWPFTMEFLIWNIMDRYSSSELLDYWLSCLTAVIGFFAAFLIFRSLRKASLFIFALAAFLAALFPLTDLTKLIIGNDRLLQKACRWGIGILVSFGFAFVASRLMAIFMRSPKRLVRWSPAFLMMIVAIVIVLRPGSSVQKSAQQPDVILVVMDTARADHLSVYGYGRPTTPGLDWFSQRAAVYEKAMSPGPWTPSAHASLLTGLLPAEHGTDGDFLAFHPPGPSLPEALKSSGYRTAAVVNNPLLAASYGWNRGFDRYIESWRPKIAGSRIIWYIRSRDEDWVWYGNTKRSLQIARHWWLASGRHSRFLFINLIDPHSPYGDPQPFKDIYLDESAQKARDLSNNEEDYDAGLVRAAGTPLKRVIAHYDADIHYMDVCLNSFFRWLEQRKELDATLVILTSDHGERLGERGLLGHELGLDQATLHVPLIIRYPNHVPAGCFPNLVQTHGIFLSILGWTGIQAPIDRFQRMPALDHQHLSVTVAQIRHQGEYLEGLRKRNPKFDPTPFAGDWNSVFDGMWKLRVSNTGNVQLFHVPDDPAEEKNLIKDFPREAKRLISFLAELPDFRYGEKPKEIPKSIQELLKSLGYIGKSIRP